MNQTETNEELKKKTLKNQELKFITVLIILFILILVVSRFALGINVGMLEGRQYQSIGYSEIRNGNFWSVAFSVFTGNISTEGTLTDAGDRTITVQSAADSASLELTVSCGEESETVALESARTEITVPGSESEFTLSIAGQNVQKGYFNAVWD